MKNIDLTGQRFGRLTVLSRSDRRAPRGARTVPLWECRCDCGAITYKATDTLTNPDISMCAACAAQYAAERARDSAGYVGGTQLTKLKEMKKTTVTASGVRGVYWDARSNKWRAQLKFKGKLMSFGSFDQLEQAVEARKKAEEEYFGAFLAEHGAV